jgi:hypothetical protein
VLVNFASQHNAALALDRLFPNPTSSAIASHCSRSDEVSRRRKTLLLFSLVSFIDFFFVIFSTQKVLGVQRGFPFGKLVQQKDKRSYQRVQALYLLKIQQVKTVEYLANN